MDSTTSSHKLKNSSYTFTRAERRHRHKHDLQVHSREKKHIMDSWSAFKAAVNPFSIASRKGVPPGNGPGRRVVFAVDSSFNRRVARARACPDDERASRVVQHFLLFLHFHQKKSQAVKPSLGNPVYRSSLRFHSSRTCFLLPPVLSPLPLSAPPHPSSEAAVRFGLDNVVRANDACSFVCAYRKLPHYTSDPGPFMEGAIVSHHPHLVTTLSANQKSRKPFDLVSCAFSPWCRCFFPRGKRFFRVFGVCAVGSVLFSFSPAACA